VCGKNLKTLAERTGLEPAIPGVTGQVPASQEIPLFRARRRTSRLLFSDSKLALCLCKNAGAPTIVDSSGGPFGRHTPSGRSCGSPPPRPSRRGAGPQGGWIAAAIPEGRFSTRRQSAARPRLPATAQTLPAPAGRFAQATCQLGDPGSKTLGRAWAYHCHRSLSVAVRLADQARARHSHCSIRRADPEEGRARASGSSGQARWRVDPGPSGSHMGGVTLAGRDRQSRHLVHAM
jgi:hypothetical protein